MEYATTSFSSYISPIAALPYSVFADRQQNACGVAYPKGANFLIA